MSENPQKQTFFLVDDHDSVLTGTTVCLREAFPGATVETAKTVQDAREHLDNLNPDVVILDLSLPESSGEPCRPKIGLKLLQDLLEAFPRHNFVVQSSHVAQLVRIKPSIDLHQGGFAIIDKGDSAEDMIKRVKWSLEGLVYTPPAMRKHIELKAEWMRVLELACYEGLNDKAIAKKMNVAERTVRNYWAKIQDVLDVYHEEGKILRIQTEIRAREKGLID